MGQRGAGDLASMTWTTRVRFRGPMRRPNSYLDFLSELEVLAKGCRVAVMMARQGSAEEQREQKNWEFATLYGRPQNAPR